MSSVAPGGLWSKVATVTAAALRSGALVPVDTEGEVLEDGGIAFSVRVAKNLARKAHQTAAPKRADPFDPPEPELTVGRVGPAHVAVLNKFNVVPNHLLVVTERFAEQDALLDRADFEALWSCLAEGDALGFYNGGAEAGASQRHRHLQLVPTPVGAGGGRTAVDAALRAGRLPFAARVVPFDADPGRAHATYLELVEHRVQPYNLLVTRDFMWVVPRSREHAHGLSVNALGFAGSLFVRDRAQLEQVRAVGPVAVLRAVTQPDRDTAPFT